MTYATPNGPQPKPIAELSAGGVGLVFQDERADRQDWSNLRVSNSSFTNIGFLKANIKNSHLTQCTFVNCYFRKATLTDVDFTGSQFIDCIFDAALIANCEFRYTRFCRTLIDYNTISHSLPEYPNLRREVLRELRTNARDTGRRDDERKFLLLELDAERQHHKARLFRSNRYYAKYTFGEQITGGRDWMLSIISDAIWGHGVKIGRIVASAFISTIVIVMALMLCGTDWSNGEETKHLGVWDALFVGTLLILGGSPNQFTPADLSAKALALLAPLTGVILFGLLVTALYRRIAK